jgi:hypothetical protein
MDFWEFVNQKEWGEAASEAALDQEARDFWESLGEEDQGWKEFLNQEDQARVKAQIQQVHTLARGIVSDLTSGVIGGAYLNDLNEWLRQVPTILRPPAEPIGLRSRTLSPDDPRLQGIQVDSVEVGEPLYGVQPLEERREGMYPRQSFIPSMVSLTWTAPDREEEAPKPPPFQKSREVRERLEPPKEWTPHLVEQVVLTLRDLLFRGATVKRCAAERCGKFFEDLTKSGNSCYCGEACKRWAFRHRQKK